MDPATIPPQVPTTVPTEPAPESEIAPTNPVRKRAVPPEIRAAISIFALVSGTVMSLFLIIAGKLSPPANIVTHSIRYGQPYTTRTLTQPPLFPMLVVGLILIGMTTLLWWYAKDVLKFSKPTVFLAVLYSSLIIITKFIISPYILYKQILSVDENAIGVSFDPSKIFANVVTVIGVFCVYLAVYGIIYKFFQKKFNREQIALNGAGSQLGKPLTLKRVVGVTAIVICAVVGGGFALLFSAAFFLGSSLQYIGYVLGGSSIIVLGALIAGIYAFRNSYEDAKRAASIMTLSSFFYVGLLMLLSIHILWVVYMAILAALWPFNVTYYSSK